MISYHTNRQRSDNIFLPDPILYSGIRSGCKIYKFPVRVFNFILFFLVLFNVSLTASCEKQLKDKLRRRNFARLCVFERMPGIFRVNGTGPVDRWCGRQVAAVRFCCNKNCILYDKRIYVYVYNIPYS